MLGRAHWRKPPKQLQLSPSSAPGGEGCCCCPGVLTREADDRLSEQGLLLSANATGVGCVHVLTGLGLGYDVKDRSEAVV